MEPFASTFFCSVHTVITFSYTCSCVFPSRHIHHVSLLLSAACHAPVDVRKLVLEVTGELSVYAELFECVAVFVQGEVVHWLACSLYAACRKGSTPTVGKGLMEGNCVSLTRILRTSKLRSVTVGSAMRQTSKI